VVNSDVGVIYRESSRVLSRNTYFQLRLSIQ